jgi:hypothetical protein
MLHPFTGSRPSRAAGIQALPLSIAAHAVVLLVIFAPRPKTSSSAGDFAKQLGSTERVQFVTAAPAEPVPVRHAARATTTRPKLVNATAPTAPSILPKLAVAPLKIDLSAVADAGVALPNVDLTSKVTDSLDFTAPPKLDAGGSGLGKGTEGGSLNSGIYTADLVERTVMPFANNPKPVYPPSMLSAGIEASFVVQFVVDTTGRVDEHSMKFPSNAGRLFVESVQRVLSRSKYRPAELGGRRVNQLVEQQFTFRIAR